MTTLAAYIRHVGIISSFIIYKKQHWYIYSAKRYCQILIEIMSFEYGTLLQSNK